MFGREAVDTLLALDHLTGLTSMANKKLTVIARGASAAIFKSGSSVPLNVQVGDLKLQVVYSTHWRARSDGIVIPGHLVLEVTCQVPPDTSLPSVCPMLANADEAMPMKRGHASI